MATERLDIIVQFRTAAAAGLKAAQTSIKGIGTAAAASTTLLRGFVGQMAALAVAVGAGAFLKSAITTFAEFDDVMRQAGAVTGATAEEMQVMRDVAKEMGQTTRFTASQAADGLRLMGMAGFEAAEATQALPDVLNLAAAGGLELGQAADIATNVLAGFGLEVENLGQVNDVLAKTFTSSNTTLVELGESFKLVGPIAKGVGADFEELLAAIGKLGDAGLKGTLSGTALRGAINALLNPTNEEAKLMEELAERIGVTSLEVKNADGSFVGFTKIIQQLEAAGLKGDEALKLFGQRAGPGMAALLQVGSKELEKMTDELRRAGGTADEIATQMEAGIGGAMREAAAAFEAVKIAIGEAFGEDLIRGIRSTRDILLSWVDAVKELKENGTIEFYAKSFEIGFTAIRTAIQIAYTAMDEFSKLIVAAAAAASGDLATAKEALKDIGSTTIELLESKGLIEDANHREVNSINDQIAATQRQIDIIKEKIAVNQEDLKGWRAKVLGTQAYQDEIDKNQRKLDALEATMSGLVQRRDTIQAKIEVDDIDALSQIGTWSREAGKSLDDAAKPTGPIGTGTSKVQETTAKVVDVEKAKTNINAAMQILRAEIQTEAAVIESEYAQGLVNLDNYFAEREALITRRIEGEIALLQEAAGQTDDVKKKEALNVQIFAKEQELQRSIIELENERFEKQKGIDEKRQQELTKIQQLELRAKKAHQDQLSRIEDSPAFGLEADFQKELADLQARQNAELAEINNYHQTKLEYLRQQAASEMEIDDAVAAHRQALQEQQNAQAEEQQRLAADQQQRLLAFQLNAYAETFGGAANALEAAYDLTGKKNKELFIASKAFAIAQAIMKTYESATSAYASLAGIPYVGPALGAAAAAAAVAAGLANVAQIKGQSLAEGGEVLGKSPNSTADNIPINATAGEFMQPVKSVQYYGKGVMEAIRRQAIPREALSRFSMPGVRYGSSHFAQGGAVTPRSADRAAGGREEGLTINNFLDPAAFSQHMQTTAGQRDVWNVLTNNPYKLKQLVFNNA